MPKTMKLQVPDAAHAAILQAAAVHGARTVQDWMITALTVAAGEELGDHELTRSEVMNAYGKKIGRMLIDAGFSTTSAVDAASDEELLAIDGFGDAALATVRGD